MRRHLALFFTRDVSLRDWERTGNLHRELAVYRVLADRGWTITFVTYGHDDAALAPETGEIGVVCNQFRLPVRVYAALLPILAPRLRDAVIKSNQTQGAEIALAVAKRLRRPFIARCGYSLSFTMEQRHGPDSSRAANARRLEGEVFGQADHAIVTTESIRERLVAVIGISPGKVSVVPNYVDLETFYPDPAVPRHPRRVLYVGRLHPEKNPLALIQACAGLDLELIIAGEGHQRAELETASQAAGVRTTFRGSVPSRELPALINSAALFVAPSLYEGHPKALIEAMACGAAVIGTDVPGIREVVRHNETGQLCAPNVGSIRDAIRGLLAGDTARAQLGSAARQYVLDHLDLRSIAVREERVLEDVLATHSAVVGT